MFTAIILNNPDSKTKSLFRHALALLFAVSAAMTASSQTAVTEIITDFGGYYKSGVGSISPVKPNNSHNLVAFNYEGKRYSTGVNDALLTSKGDAFTPADFRALPLQNLTSTPNGNTKIGMGSILDGLLSGAGLTPSRNIGQYLNDGVKGLDMGTGVANLPAGTMFLSVSGLQPTNVGDGIPDILVTQIAEPSSKYDRYSFTDINGNVIGNSKNVVLNNISPVGKWMADFFNAIGLGILDLGYTNTQRDLRLWAADFSVFGIDASNISQVAYFRIDLGGDSDIAFVGYNTSTVSVNAMLDLPTSVNRLTRATRNEDINTVSVYPNPARTTVNISHPVSKGGEKILVYNIQGMLVMQQSVAKKSALTRLEISGLRAGSYQVVFTSEYEKLAQKLIVQ